MRPIFACIFLGAVFAASVVLSACFRLPVQVVQYQDETPIVVAPVGTITQTSATTAVMNHSVLPPEKVGPLPPKPQPSESDWLGILLGVASAAIPGLGGIALLWQRLRNSTSALVNVIESVQKVKAEHPESRDSINEVLAKHQTPKTKEVVQKIKGKSAKQPTHKKG